MTSLHSQLESSIRDATADGIHPRRSREILDAVLVLLVVVAAAALSLHGLGNNAFWDDEANTALFARNWLHTGKLTAFDGINVVGFRQGAELNEKLENVYMPPVQYWVAALGMRLLGSTTIGGRLPFVIAGLLAIPVLALFVKWHLRSEVPSWLAAALVALSPAYLMFIRQCRYYSLVVLLTLTILASLAHAKSTVRARVLSLVVGCSAAWLLMFTNYLNAVALAACLPAFLVLKRYRSRCRFEFVAAVLVTLLVAGLYVLWTANPLQNNVSYKDTITGIPRIVRLLYWHLAGLPQFEFFPVAGPVLALGLLVHSRRGKIARLVGESFALCLVVVVYTVTVVAFSPQTVTEFTKVADMRYAVSLMPIGAAATATVLCAAWLSSAMTGPVLSIVTAAMIVGTNAFSSALAGWLPIRSTLYEYVRENRHNYVTGNEAIIEFVKRLPKPYVLRVIPDYMAYPAMFYVPEQHYCCQLPDDFGLKHKLPERVPNYVYSSPVSPDYFIVGADIDPQQLLAQCLAIYGSGRYHLLPHAVGADYRDASRPEIPWHSFGPLEDRRHGFWVLERVGLGKGAPSQRP